MKAECPVCAAEITNFGELNCSHVNKVTGLFTVVTECSKCRAKLLVRNLMNDKNIEEVFDVQRLRG